MLWLKDFKERSAQIRSQSTPSQSEKPAEGPPERPVQESQDIGGTAAAASSSKSKIEEEPDAASSDSISQAGQPKEASAAASGMKSVRMTDELSTEDQDWYQKNKDLLE